MTEKPTPLTPEEREQAIKEFMDAGYSRDEAEFAVDIDTGESEGDLIDWDGER